MKREIEFRGKRVDNGEWVYGGFTFDAIDSPRITTKSGEGLVFHKVDPLTVNQFTGLLDKNGVKIFEGDKLLDTVNGKTLDVCFGEGSPMRYNGWIAKHEGGMQYRLNNDSDSDRNSLCEVIGNIHDK